MRASRARIWSSGMWLAFVALIVIIGWNFPPVDPALGRIEALVIGYAIRIGLLVFLFMVAYGLADGDHEGALNALASEEERDLEGITGFDVVVKLVTIVAIGWGYLLLVVSPSLGFSLVIPYAEIVATASVGISLAVVRRKRRPGDPATAP